MTFSRKNGEKQLEQQKKDHDSEVCLLGEVREAFRAKVRAVRPKAAAKPNFAGSGSSGSRQKKYPKRHPQGEIAHSEAKALSQPESFVWRAMTDGRWCGRYPPYP